MTRSTYKTTLRAYGRKSVAGMKLRSDRSQGGGEFMWCPRAKEYRWIEHPPEPQPECNVTPINAGRRA
jgi:hypothetical protein